MPIESFRDLIVWQRAMALAKEMYGATRCFPKEEIYGLTSQIRRAAISIPSNIAEGWGRQSTGDYIHFLKVAQGSAAELETEIILSSELEFISKELLEISLSNLKGVQVMLNSLIRSLNSK
jgi:four helix bundle protein